MSSPALLVVRLDQVAEPFFFFAMHTLKTIVRILRYPNRYPAVCSRWRLFTLPGIRFQVFLIGRLIALRQVEPPCVSSVIRRVIP